jgi:hypothetical protein
VYFEFVLWLCDASRRSLVFDGDGRYFVCFLSLSLSLSLFLSVSLSHIMLLLLLSGIVTYTGAQIIKMAKDMINHVGKPLEVSVVLLLF